MSGKFIPLSVPNFKGNELKYVTDTIRTEWVSTVGAYVNDFEHKIADYVHVTGAVSCQNGTSGLHTALLVSGVGREDAVVVPTLTFIAAVNPVRYIGACPIFMDCDDSLCLDPVKLENYCQEECDFIEGKLFDRKTKRHIKALIIVHVFGNMADMVSILPIAKRYNITLIEDATEALGSYYAQGELKGKYAGTVGDIGVYSFNGNKIITTGGGGMIVSDNQEYLDRAKHLTTQAKSDELYYTHDEVGYNYRMTNLQAALGVAQLEQLENFIGIKQSNYENYKERIEPIEGLKLLPFRDDIRSNYWFYALYCDGFALSRDEMIRYFSEWQVQVRPIWGLIHEQKPYQEFPAYRVEKAKEYWKHVVNIPCSTNLTREDVDTVVQVLLEVR